MSNPINFDTNFNPVPECTSVPAENLPQVESRRFSVMTSTISLPLATNAIRESNELSNSQSLENKNIKQITQNTLKEQTHTNKAQFQETTSIATYSEGNKVPILQSDLGQYGGVARKREQMKNKSKQQKSKQQKPKLESQLITDQRTRMDELTTQIGIKRSELEKEQQKNEKILPQIKEKLRYLEEDYREQIKNYKEWDDIIKNYDKENMEYENEINKLTKNIFDFNKLKKIKELKNKINTNKDLKKLAESKMKKIKNKLIDNKKEKEKLDYEYTTALDVTLEIQSKIAKLETQLQEAKKIS